LPEELAMHDQCGSRERAFGSGFVARARLVRRLMDARDLPLVVLTAPAG
jgi:ATP/maltotriose-dependent transcriptional regulator MalT